MSDPDANRIRDLLRTARADAPAPRPWTDIQQRAASCDDHPPARRTGITWVATAAAVILLVVGLVVVSGARDDRSTVPAIEPRVTLASSTTVPSVSSRQAAEVAHAYWEAIAASDLDAAVALIDPVTYANSQGSIQPPGRPDSLEVLLDWYEVVGWEWQVGDCTDVSDGVAECDVVASTAWSDAVGIAPLANEMQVRVGDDGITSLNFSVAANDCCPGFDEFNRWVIEMYPDDAELMWDQSAEPDAETLLHLFELNTTRFVDAQQNT